MTIARRSFIGKMTAAGMATIFFGTPAAAGTRPRVLAKAKSVPLRGVLLLTFDDSHWDQWLAAQPIFAKYGAHVTFFPCGKFDDKALAALRVLRDAGHTIGLHGVHHRMMPPVFAEKGGAAYWDAELAPQRTALAGAGIRANVFAYPSSARTPETDAFLKSKGLGLLRSGKGGAMDILFPAHELQSRTMVEGLGIGSHYKTDIGKICALIRRAAAENQVLTTYSHDIAPEPSKIGMRTEWLERILATAADCGIAVKGFGEL